MDDARKMTRLWLTTASRTPFTNVVDEAKLTPRQMDIIRLKFLQGRTNYQIAMDLNVSLETVRNEIQKAYNSINNVLLGNNKKQGE